MAMERLLTLFLCCCERTSPPKKKTLNLTRMMLDQTAFQRHIPRYKHNKNGLLLMTCPIQGSETYMETVAKGIASTLKLDFLSIDKHDFGPQQVWIVASSK